MHMLKRAVALALLAFSLNASATDDGYSAVYSTCMDNSGGKTYEMLECIGAEIGQQDARLNQNYKAAMNALAPELQIQLRDAQRLWIKFRDADCTLLGSLSGGTIDRINGATCILDITKERADDLAWLAMQGNN